MSLLVLRSLLLVIAAGLGASFAEQWNHLYNPWLTFGAVMLVAVIVIASDWLVRRKSLDIVSSVYFGTIVGVFLSYVLRLALDPLMSRFPNVRQGVETLLAAVLVYACISLLLQTRNEFRFIIPYVEFAREVKGQHPYLLDTSVIIDGRIADLAETRVFDSPLIAPQFVLNELQAIADSSDRLKRNRGRRGLDILNRLRSTPDVDFRVLDQEAPGSPQQAVDLKLVLLARELAGKILTNDFNLNKVAKVHGVPVVNLNDLGNALKSAYMPGEEVGLKVLRAGEEPGQGVGFLDDGTMVVIEGGREHVNKQVHVTVTKVLQTSAGRMIFARTEKVSEKVQG
jgi:uncharacterized protein YacL